MFDVTKEVDEVLISLQQKDMKIHRKVGQGENLTIGFNVFKVTYSVTLPQYFIHLFHLMKHQKYNSKRFKGFVEHCTKIMMRQETVLVWDDNVSQRSVYFGGKQGNFITFWL